MRVSGDVPLNRRSSGRQLFRKQAPKSATDDRDLQTEGQADQAKGNLKQAGEKIKDAFKS